MITVARTTEQDIRDIMEEPSVQCLADLLMLGLGKDQATAKFSGFLPDSEAWTALDNGQPFGAMGWDRNDGVWYSWAATSPSFYDPKRRDILLALRRHIKGVADRNPDVVLVMKPVVQISPKMKKWMEFLGYTYEKRVGLFVYE